MSDENRPPSGPEGPPGGDPPADAPTPSTSAPPSQIPTYVGPRTPTPRPPQDLTGEWQLRGIDTALTESGEHPLLGSYLLLSKIADGGMGTVYHAKHQHLGTDVAVKVLLPNLKDREDGVVERFFREARLAAQLSSPHLVGVLDVARDEGSDTHYLVMEYVRGKSAREWLTEHPGGVDERSALAVALAATRGLEAAHAAGVIHRDVKPANILLAEGEDGRLQLAQAKLSDLGLARPDAAGHTITGTGVAMGTPGYMSPEQAKGVKSAGRRVDVFSVGATLYALLVGKAPFQRETPFETLTATVACDYQDLTEARSDVSPATAALVARCLAKDPDHRFPSASELREALERCVSAVGGSTGEQEQLAREIAPPVRVAAGDRKQGLPRTATAFLAGALVAPVVLGILALVVAGGLAYLLLVGFRRNPGPEPNSGQPPPAPASPEPAWSAQATGSVQINGVPETGTSAGPIDLTPGTEVRTGAEAATVRFGNGDQFGLQPSTTAVVGQEFDGSVTLVLVRGRVEALVSASTSLGTPFGVLRRATAGSSGFSVGVGGPERSKKSLASARMTIHCASGSLELAPRTSAAARRPTGEEVRQLGATIPAECLLTIERRSANRKRGAPGGPKAGAKGGAGGGTAPRRVLGFSTSPDNAADVTLRYTLRAGAGKEPWIVASSLAPGTSGLLEEGRRRGLIVRHDAASEATHPIRVESHRGEEVRLEGSVPLDSQIEVRAIRER